MRLISYEKEKDSTEASYVDKEKNVELAGNDAMKELHDKFKLYFLINILLMRRFSSRYRRCLIYRKM
ncbi:hypothetical protein A8F94_21545 [Bacillus sp. FJAT-27225]|nr:hypothetical protein A8F94_21545 [Bacillus sp. FJAT-27225]